MADSQLPVKHVLWTNLVALMERAWGGENLRRLARESGIGPGGSTRLKDPDTSVRLVMLEQVAKVFGVAPWQLLAPDLGANLYVIDDERRLVPVYRPTADVRVLPERRASGGGLRKTADQKDRYAERTETAAPRKSGRTAA